MAIGSISGLLRPGTSAGGSTADLSTVSVSQQTRSRVDSQDKVSLSTTERQKQKGLESALRSLSDLQNFTDAAASATDRVGELIQKTINIADRINAEVDPTKRQALADEGAAYLSEIDDIASTAETGSGRDVVAQGSISYTFNLGDVTKSSADSISVNIPSVTIRQSDLGTTGITSSTLRSTTDDDRDKLEQAARTVSNTAAAIDSVNSQISSVAEKFSIGRANEGRSTDPQKAEELAKSISQKVTKAEIVQQANNLDPLRVSDLLNVNLEELSKKDPKEEEKSSSVQATSADSTF